MAEFFQYFFEEGDFDKAEVSVKCPYPHLTATGVEYFESNPSASVNTDKGVFHCMRCGASKSEIGFIADQLGCSYEVASKIKEAFDNSQEDIYTWERLNELPDYVRTKANNLGISNEVLDLLHVRSPNLEAISFPVTIYNKIVDVRDYNPDKRPKVMSRTGALSGLIIPFDIWRTEPKDKWTLLVAGEKDMAVARSIGFKAITLTGGEGVQPTLLHEFKDRKIAIFYDNDDAGKQGAKRLAATLKQVASSVKVVTAFHEVCVEKGEDFTDLVTKYNATPSDIMQFVSMTPEFTEEDALEEIEKMYPTISLFEASQPNRIGKTVRSNIQVVATYESSFSIPTSVTATKKKQSEDGELPVGTQLSWNLSESTLKDILHLMDNNFKEGQITDNLKMLMRMPPKEPNMPINRLTKETVFKCSVTDLFESTSKDVTQMEYTAYSVGVKLESGKKYKATYQIVPHPYKGQQLIMLIMDIDNAADTVTSFKVDEDVKKTLDVFRNIPGTVEDKVNSISGKVKGIIGFDADDTLIQAIDLTYHTVLEFDFGDKFKAVRGYLDTLVVTESRVGKSSTAEALRDTYNLGVFASLAGGSATKAGLIGGANKVDGSYQTRAGLIPQNHRNLVIFEELAKCNSDILRELTDVRSSNEVRIVRVNGSLYLPALVRMLTLTNVKTHGTTTRPISSYPHGIDIVVELIGAAEDIARYDMMLVLGTPGSRTMDFGWEPDTPFDKREYQTRIRWVWSRSKEQVILSNEVLQHIVDVCNKLNDEFDSHIKIFGTEAWKKVTRLAIAIAGYIVSTDETYENIIVTKEAVDYADKFLRRIYDNDTFRLRQYVERERQFSEIDDEGVELLQDLYITNTALLDQLEQASYSNRNELMAATGVKQDEFNAIMNSLIRGMFVRYKGPSIMPTERFRKGMRMIDRYGGTPMKVGEVGQIR